MSPALTSHIADGTFAPLAIAAPARIDSLPNVPTFSELGYAAATKMSVFGFYAPGGTLVDIVAKLNADLHQVVDTHEIQKLLVHSKTITANSTPQQVAKDLKEKQGPNKNSRTDGREREC